jgi:hypothetical protein
MAQTGGPEVAVMTVRILPSGRLRVVLAYDGKTEEYLIKNMVVSDKAQDETTADYQRIIGKLYQQGYALKSTFSQASGHFTTLVFVKGQ